MADKFGHIKGEPVKEWKQKFLKDWNPSEDFSFGLKHAERFCKIAADGAIAKILLKQAKKAEGTKDQEWRYQVADKFMRIAEVRCKGLLMEINATATSVIKKTLF